MHIYFLQHYRSIGTLLVLMLLDCHLPVLAASLEVNITPTGVFQIIPGIAVVDQSIATVEIKSSEDFSVSLKDNTNGVLRNGQNVIPYTVSYNNGTQITLSTSPTTVESNTLQNSKEDRPLTIFVGSSQSVGISAGSYSVTITAEITVN
jgi:hypothetical protein